MDSHKSETSSNGQGRQLVLLSPPEYSFLAHGQQAVR